MPYTLVAAERRRRFWGATDTELGHGSLHPKENLKVAQATSWSNMVSPKQAKNLLAFLFLVARPGAPSSFLVTSSDALVTTSFLLLLVKHLLLEAMHLFLVAWHLLLVAKPSCLLHVLVQPISLSLSRSSFQHMSRIISTP